MSSIAFFFILRDSLFDTPSSISLCLRMVSNLETWTKDVESVNPT